MDWYNITDKIYSMKMKKFTLVLILGLVSTFTFAQTFDFFQDGDTIKQDIAGASVDFKGYVKNLTNKEIVSTWLVTDVNFPAGQQWDFIVCDGNICYLPGNASQTQAIAQDSTELLKVTIVSGGIGTGTLTIRAADDATGETQEYGLKLETLTTSANELAEVAVFSQNAPNPFESYTRVKYDLKGNNGQIVITDMTGRQVSVHNLNDNAGQIEIGQELGRGIYFYTLTVDGQPVMTKRLQKL